MLTLLASPTSREIGRLALPSIAINITLPLLNLVDIAIAGHLGDSSFLASLALGSQFYSIILGCCHFLRMSTSATTARASGAQNPQELSLTLQAGFVWALLLSFLFLLFHSPILFLCLSLSNPQENLVPSLSLYLSIRLFDLPAQLLILVSSGWLLGIGKPLKILTITLITASLNAILSLLFVFVFSFGIAGIAYGTLIASYIGALIGLLFVAKPLLSRFASHIPLLFSPSRFSSLFFMNTHLFTRSLLLQLALTLFFVKSGSLHTDILATNSLLMSFIILTTYGLDGFADAGEVCMGRAKGQKSKSQAKSQACLVIKVAFLWALLMALAYALFFLLFADFLIAIQTDIPSLREKANLFLPLMILFPFLIVGFNTLDGLFLGAGMTFLIRNSMVFCFAVFAFMIYNLPQTYGHSGLWASLVIFYLLRTGILTLCLPLLLRSISQKIHP